MTWPANLWPGQKSSNGGGIMLAIDPAEAGDIIGSDSRLVLGWVCRGRSRTRSDLNDRLRAAAELVQSKGLKLRFVPRRFNVAGLHNERHPAKKHGELTERSNLPDSAYAFPKQRKEPLTDAEHVKNALARFDQILGVSNADRDQAFANIKKAAEYYDIEVEETDWHELGSKPHTRNPAHG